MSTSSYDVVIIGAGLAGLAAGIRCAQFFRRVAIVEAHSKLGGLNSYYHKQSRAHLFSNGLHAVTNFNPSSRRWGRNLVERNLGLRPEDFALYPPRHPSRISFPDFALTFDNSPGTLEAAIAQQFPAEVDGYRQLISAIMAESGRPEASSEDCHAFMAAYVRSPELRDALALPVLTYGGYREGAIDSRTFAVLFRSLLLEGCGSPVDMRTLLDRLLARYTALGGELIRRAAVVSLPATAGEVARVVLADGRELTATWVLSSAGLHETGQLCDANWGEPGTVSVFQWIGAYDRPLDQIGISDTLHFVCRTPRFDWHIPGDRQFTEVLTYSAGDSYAFPEPAPAHFKISCFSKMQEWAHLDDDAYAAQKRRYASELLAVSAAIYPQLATVAPLVEDTFTPRTVERFTRHPGGTIYGGVRKTLDGRTPLRNLFIIGNDQGGMGIMGALTSGVLVTNFNLLLNAG